MKNTESVSPQIIHIPEKPSFLPHLQPTVNVLAAVIEPQDANTLVRKLNQIAPLENLRHVKHVPKKCIDGGKPQLSLLLSLAVENDGEVLELVKSYQLSTFITKVCKYAATSKEEWDEQCKLWPTSYHLPTYNISGITGFSEEESQSAFGFMRHTVDLATSSVGQVVNAAVIVDPSTNQVIASACDQVISSASLANEVSKEGSCSNYLENLNQLTLLLDGSIGESKHIINNVACVHPWRWALQSFGCCRPLRHAAIVAIEYSAARDRQLFPDYKALSPLKDRRPRSLTPKLMAIVLNCSGLIYALDVTFTWLGSHVQCAQWRLSIKELDGYFFFPKFQCWCTRKCSQIARGAELESPLCCFRGRAA